MLFKYHYDVPSPWPVYLEIETYRHSRRDVYMRESDARILNCVPNLYVKREGHNNGLGVVYVALVLLTLVECQIKSMMIVRKKEEIDRELKHGSRACVKINFFFMLHALEWMWKNPRIWIKWTEREKEKTFLSSFSSHRYLSDDIYVRQNVEK